VQRDGTGLVLVARTRHVKDQITRFARGLNVVEVDVVGLRPRSYCARRWAEAAVLLAGARGAAEP